VTAKEYFEIKMDGSSASRVTWALHFAAMIVDLAGGEPRVWWGRNFEGVDAVRVIPGLRMGAAPGRRPARALARAGVTRAIGRAFNRAPWPLWDT
jgi:hypothetical protein